MDQRYLMLIDALSSTPRDLQRLLKRVSPQAALVRPAETEWCIKDVVAHLVDIEGQFRSRLQRIVTIDNPHEPLINPNEAAHDLTMATGDLIELFAGKRRETTTYLETLTQPQWLRVCTHETYGITRLRKQVEILIGHDNEHLAQIVNIREFLERPGRAV